MKRFYIALGLSLIFHLAQYSIVDLTNRPRLFNSENATTIELVEKKSVANKENEKPILSIPKVKSIVNNEPAKFFSENDQRVEKETITKNLGVTKNKNSDPQNNKPQLKNDPGAEPEFARSVRQSTETASRSAIEFVLPSDIAAGTATNLNTDSHIYASFYNRVTELFYIRWAQRLDALWQRLSMDEKRNLSGQIWATDIEVWLRSNGEYDRSLIMKPSGYKNFDNAAVFAFQNARFFPNPPKAKVEADGYIRLRYRIAVHVR
jgi:TonB family protein